MLGCARPPTQHGSDTLVYADVVYECPVCGSAELTVKAH